MSREIFQNPRYRGRVELKDPQMKNGDASVLLKNVNTNDTGTYECRVITPSNNRRRRDVGNRVLVSSVHLIVSEGPEKEIKNEHHQYGDANDEPPGGARGRVGLGVSVGLVCLVVVVVVLVVKCQRAR
ncbi:sodium channel subunit beta-2-like isoform X1 [Trematomus bernacchii]|uniref:sodium channel subunit beta-2-like isoform X1 n=1 Tax=Trematomus bernacchii TaxID=40690 RepID=UPI00146D7865|nr:sodium channel subunit beta-2-like isoform X1 [Trematomus bernacchii]